jgi:hypothetical protein
MTMNASYGEIKERTEKEGIETLELLVKGKEVCICLSSLQRLETVLPLRYIVPIHKTSYTAYIEGIHNCDAARLFSSRSSQTISHVGYQ